MTKSDFLKCECRHCAGHIEFPAAAVGETIPCPHCGQPTTLAGKNPRRPLIFGIAALLVIAAAAAGFILLKKPGPAAAPAAVVSPATNQTEAVAAAAPPDEIVTNSFGLSDIQLEKTPGTSLVYVTGLLRNLSDKERYGVKVEFGLFETNDAPDGQATDYHQILQPHDEWHFKALVLDSKATSARLNAVVEDQ